jgi:hypothetical protein
MGCTSTGLKRRVLLLPVFLLLLLLLGSQVLVVTVLLNSQQVSLVGHRCTAVWLLSSSVDHVCAAWG